MKVREALNNPSGLAAVPGKEDRRVSDNREAGFYSRLRNIEGKDYEERLKALADTITAQGEKLGDKVDIRELARYKKLISEFLSEAVNGSLKFSKESFLDRRGRYKVYATIKKINGELELLTRDVLSDEKDNIRILQRLDDIRGLILDLLL